MKSIRTFKVKYEGSEIRDYHNDRGSYARDNVIGALLPETICQCSLARRNSDTCMRSETINKIARGFAVAPELSKLFAKTGCDDEKCVLRAAQDQAILSVSDAGIEEQIAFKRSGPTDVALFTDSVIQSQLYAWMYQFADFWAYNFNMLNYAEKCMRKGRVLSEPDTLATVRIADLRTGRVPDPIDMTITESAKLMLAEKRAHGIHRAACVVNTDVYDGDGKHWMALFVDMRPELREWTVEFFNSAAIRPESEWLEWMTQTRDDLIRASQVENVARKVSHVYVCNLWHQHSKTECGPYSLFYVWARLNGVPAQYFLQNVVPDQIMFEFRQHLFNTGDDVGKKFDFAEFAKNVKIKWDREQVATK